MLHLINNYTGDRMAFDMGKEMAEAEGITIGTLLVDDDVAVKDSTYTVGRRGVAGNFFVIKAVGAASEKGADLDELVRIGEQVNGVTRTMGMALTSCTPPAKGSPLFELGDDEMEMGVGHPRRAGPSPREAGRRERDRRRAGRGGRVRPAVRQGRRCRADDQRSRWYADQRALSALRPRARAARRPRHQRRGAATSASTARRSTWRAARSRWCKLDDEIISLLDAPAEIAVRTF